MKTTIGLIILLACFVSLGCNSTKPPAPKISHESYRLAPNPQPNNHTDALFRGDANFNGRADLDDLADMNTPGVIDSTNVNADVNCDGRFNMDDVGSWIENILANGGQFCPSDTSLDCMAQPIFWHRLGGSVGQPKPVLEHPINN